MLDYLDDGQEVVIVCNDAGAPLFFEPPKRVACKVPLRRPCSNDACCSHAAADGYSCSSCKQSPKVRRRSQVLQFDGKVATLENGRVVSVPSFVKEGDIIMVLVKWQSVVCW